MNFPSLFVFYFKIKTKFESVRDYNKCLKQQKNKITHQTFAVMNLFMLTYVLFL